MTQDKTKKVLNVPPLRFPEFTGEWEKYRNETLFQTISEKNKDKSITKILSASQQQGMVERDSLGLDIKFDYNSISSYKIVRKGDYVIHLRSFQGGFAFSEQIGVCSPAYTILRPSPVISYGFLKYHFVSNKFIDALRIVTYGIRDGRSISVEEWLKLYTSLPKTEEQNKIIQFLNLIEKRIETQIRVIEDLQSLKKAISAKIFTTLNEVKTEKLGNLCTITTGKLDANAMTDDGQYMFFTCSRETYKTDTFAFDGEALLIAGNGEIGSVKYYDGKFNAYQRTYVLQNFSANIKYLQFYIEHYLPKRVLKEKNVGAMPYIILSTLADMKIRLPNLQKQNNIVQVLQAIENKISVESKLLSLLSTQKQYLLQQMFI